jgi:hypothetical protein
MKKLLVLALTAFLSICLYGQQQIKIINFTVKNQLPANVDSWNTVAGSLLLVAQKPPTIQIKDMRLVVQIKANGAIICGSMTGIPVDDFTTRTFSASELTGALAGCPELKDGNYTICAQFFAERRMISNEVCKEFRVETPKETDFAPPTLITPENGKSFTEDELSRPVSFRWTPLVPKPRETVTYRLRVWQLMQGQNGTQAMRSNQPIVTKDVDNLTQAVVTGILTGPCKPPYLCDFIWQVQAMNKEGKPMGRNNGNSEPYTFSAKENETGGLKNVYPEDNKKFSKSDASKPITFRWTALVPKPREAVTYRLRVWQLMQGQNGTQARQSNQPIVTKDVNDLTQVVVNSILTGPCKPPYLCDFIWDVQALSRDGKPMGRNDGRSEPFTFKIADDNINIKIDSVDASCCINGKQNIYIKISNLHLTNPAQVTAIKYRVNGTGPITTLSPTTPGTPFTIPPNTSQAFTGSINCIDSMKTIKFIVDAIWPSDPDNINNETAWDTLKCACDPCRTIGVTITKDTLTTTASTSGQILLSGTLSGLNPNTVKKVTMELIYFNIIQTKDSNCVKCAENKEWGNFIKPGTTAFAGFSPGMLNGINFGREWTWISTVQKECDAHGGGTGHGDGDGTGNPTGANAKCSTCGTATGTVAANAPPEPGSAAAKMASAGPIIIVNPQPHPKANSFSLPIAVPPGSSLNCCGDKIKICIRYTVWDFCCHACDIIKCYEIERKAQ